MSIPAAYIGVVIIWATTPLAIKWSSEGAGHLFGVASRMVLGLVVCLLLVALLGRRMRWHGQAVKTYLAAGLGLWGAMTSVYWGAQFIPSGLISVVFGFTPVVTGVMAAVWLGEKVFTPFKIIGMLLGVGGIGMIFVQGLALGQGAAMGLVAVILSVHIHGLSSVWVKRLAEDLPALETTTGALLVATPLFLATWLWADASLPASVSAKAVGSIIYLGVVGSVVGFILYYYILHRVEVNKVSLITLMTPILALFLGQWINHESISSTEWLGVVVILIGLSCFQWGDGRRYR